MEKLIMLIDIYEEEVVGVHSVGEKITDKEEARIISKKFGFIEWLVGNDKIEWSEKTAFVTFLERGINADKSDALVSLLAVKDNPIDFLIQILKKEEEKAE